MKPSWKDAPDWARFLAQDENGAWTWFEEKSRVAYQHEDLSRGARLTQQITPRWYNTLEERPMKTDYNPDHYRFQRTLPHSGNAVEPPDGCEHVPSVLWWGGLAIVALIGLLMVVEGVREWC